MNGLTLTIRDGSSIPNSLKTTRLVACEIGPIVGKLNRVYITYYNAARDGQTTARGNIHRKFGDKHVVPTICSRKVYLFQFSLRYLYVQKYNAGRSLRRRQQSFSSTAARHKLFVRKADVGKKAERFSFSTVLCTDRVICSI